MDDMGRAFEMIFEGGAVLFARDNNGTAAVGGQVQESQQEDEAAASQHNNNTYNNNGVPALPEYMSNASLEARNQVIRIQFSWYQFAELPREVLGRTYPNLQHLDIRQNGQQFSRCFFFILLWLIFVSKSHIIVCFSLCSLISI